MSIKSFISTLGFVALAVIGSDTSPAAQCAECPPKDSLLPKEFIDSVKAHAVRRAITAQMLVVDTLSHQADKLTAELTVLRKTPVRIIVKHRDVVGSEVWIWRYYKYPNGKTKFKDVLIKVNRP